MAVIKRVTIVDDVLFIEERTIVIGNIVFYLLIINGELIRDEILIIGQLRKGRQIFQQLE